MVWIVLVCVVLYCIADQLTKSQIKAGNKAPKRIEALIEDEDFGSKLTKANKVFYTHIPHDFGYVCTIKAEALAWRSI